MKSSFYSQVTSAGSGGEDVDAFRTLLLSYHTRYDVYGLHWLIGPGASSGWWGVCQLSIFGLYLDSDQLSNILNSVLLSAFLGGGLMSKYKLVGG